MNKILVDKETNIISQIINIDDGYEFDINNYGDMFYLINDESNQINSYNLKYNKEEQKFEVVDGLEANPIAETILKQDEIANLKAENDLLKADLEMIKKALGLI